MNASAKKIAIVGQGIMGLACASKLLERGYLVDIYSRNLDNKTTSISAGAYWWPHRAYPAERVAKWSRETYEEYKSCRSDPQTGVQFQEHLRFCLDPDDSAYARYILDEYEEIEGLDYGVPCEEAYRLIVPMIDVRVYMPYLKNRLKAGGVNFYEREINSASEMFPDYNLVVNCTGVWAYYFAKDSGVFPIRGQVVQVSLPSGLKSSTRLYQKDDNFTLILPRSNDVVLGGTAQEGSWDLAPNDTDTSIIVERCAKLVPSIRDASILGVHVGLRPGRKEVRLELDLSDPEHPVVHNYGHGGGGFTVAWGCANEVEQKVDEYFSQR